MAGRRRLERNSEERRPVVTDDFIYDEPQQSFGGNGSDPISSETPEEAVRRLRRSARRHNEEKPEESPDEASSEKKASPERGTVYSSGIMLDENLQPVYDESGEKKHRLRRLIRGVLITVSALVLMIVVSSFIFSRNSTPDDVNPQNGISAVIEPVRSFFSGLTTSFRKTSRDTAGA